MADPAFNGVALTSAAGRTRIGSPQVRLYTETLPGVDGLFAQPHGRGGREIEVVGLLGAAGASPSSAVEAVMDLLRQRQNLADGATAAAFTGSDGRAYANCMMTSFQHDPPRVTRAAGGGYLAYLPVRARLIQLTP